MGELTDGYFAAFRGDLSLARALIDRLNSSSRTKHMMLASIFRLGGDFASARTALDRLRIELVTNDQWDNLCEVTVCLAAVASGTGDRQAACDHLRAAIRMRAFAPFSSKLPFAILEVAGLTAADDPSRASRLASLSRGLNARGERWPIFPQDIARVRQVLIDHGADPDLPFPNPMPSEAEVVAEAFAALDQVT